MEVQRELKLKGKHWFNSYLGAQGEGRSDIRCSRVRWKEARRGCTMSRTVTRLINGATFSSKNVGRGGGATAEQHFYDSNYLLLNKGCSPYQERAHLNRVKYNLLLCHFQTTYQIVVTSIYDSNVYLANCTSASDCWQQLIVNVRVIHAHLTMVHY